MSNGTAKLDFKLLDLKCRKCNLYFLKFLFLEFVSLDSSLYIYIIIYICVCIYKERKRERKGERETYHLEFYKNKYNKI